MRKSYAGIGQKIHPDVKAREFVFESSNPNTEDFKDIIEELSIVLEDATNLMTEQVSGIGCKNKQSNFINALKNRDINEMQKYFSNMFRNEATYGYLSPSFTDVLNQEIEVSFRYFMQCRYLL